MAQMRLDKLLTHLNCGSRKEVQALIRAGRVSVEGQVVRDPAPSSIRRLRRFLWTGRCSATARSGITCSISPPV